MPLYPIQKLCRSRCNTLEVQCVGWWSRQNCFNFWIYVAIWAWNWICKGSAAWLKKHWVHTSTAMLLFWAAKKHHVMDVTYFKSCIFSQKKTLIYFQTYSKVSTSSTSSLSLNDLDFIRHLCFHKSFLQLITLKCKIFPNPILKKHSNSKNLDIYQFTLV